MTVLFFSFHVSCSFGACTGRYDSHLLCKYDSILTPCSLESFIYSLTCLDSVKLHALFALMVRFCDAACPVVSVLLVVKEGRKVELDLYW